VDTAPDSPADWRLASGAGAAGGGGGVNGCWTACDAVPALSTGSLSCAAAICGPATAATRARAVLSG
jgi:hypothetical protein